ncbi:MAG: nuclear transport factor 2 family protein [Dehalococcoidia bacterium]
MTVRAAAALMRAYYAALDAPNLDALDELFAPDADWRFPGQVLRGDQVKRAMTRSLATGLRMEHRIGHMVERGNVAICELVATNTLGEQQFLVPGAVVCEARDDRIQRLAAYPDAGAMTPFLTALAAARRS